MSRYQGKIASCPIEGCKCSRDRTTEGGEDMPVMESFEHVLYKAKYNNLNWSKEYVLLDPFDGLWIVPCKIIKKNGKVYYKIYYSTEEKHKALKGTFEASVLEKMKVYKFKTRRNNNLFWEGKSNLIHHSDQE